MFNCQNFHSLASLESHMPYEDYHMISIILLEELLLKRYIDYYALLIN